MSLAVRLYRKGGRGQEKYPVFGRKMDPSAPTTLQLAGDIRGSCRNIQFDRERESLFFLAPFFLAFQILKQTTVSASRFIA